MLYAVKQAKIAQMIALDALRNGEPERAALNFNCRQWWMKEARKTSKKQVTS